MHLTAIGHLEDKYIRKMKRLNREAFPKKERIDFDKLIDLSSTNSFDFLAIKNEDSFVGFYLIAKNAEIVYLFFFAVAKKQQTKEYGNKLLASLLEYYPFQQVVIDIEEISQFPDSIQREAKKEFYITNGFKETGYTLSNTGRYYELLCNKEDFNKDGFMSLLEEIEPVINEIKKGTFSPVITEKKPL